MTKLITTTIFASLAALAIGETAAHAQSVRGYWTNGRRCSINVPRDRFRPTFRVRVDCGRVHGWYTASWRNNGRRRFFINSVPGLSVRMTRTGAMKVRNLRTQRVRFLNRTGRAIRPRPVEPTPPPPPPRPRPRNPEGRIYGTWMSNSGNVFEIPRSPGNTFDIVVNYKNGRRGLMRGRWVPGMVGVQFKYTDGRYSYTGTFIRGRVRVESASGSNWWKRHYRRSRGMRAAGVWRSTSGNTFTVPAQPGAFNIILTTPRGGKQLYRASWVAGMEGVQFRYSGNTATYNATSGRIRVVDTAGRANYWTRVR